MTHDKTKCEYCGQVLPLGVDKRTRQIRSYHFEQHTAERKKEEASQPTKPAELSLKRYEPEIWREDRIRMELDEHGDWVKYEDVLRLIGAIEAPQPAKRVPLTDEEMRRIYETPELAGTYFPALKRIVRAIEAAHGITGETK